MIEPITITRSDMQYRALTSCLDNNNSTPPLMLLVHGFPDTPHSFYHQLKFFSAQGYRVVAPWLRGYDTPAADNNFSANALGDDLLQIMDSLDYHQAIVVGHDWGAGAAYAAAVAAPERISHLITSAVPYGPGLMQAMAGNGDQQRRSWYVFFFQTPLAEHAVKTDDYALIKRLWQEWAGPEWQGDETSLAAVLDCFNQPGAIEAALQYYRQAFAVPPPEQYLPIACPALYIHGQQDGCIGIELAQPDQSLFTNGCDYYSVAAAGHFVHLEKPDEFNQRVAAFIAT